MTLPDHVRAVFFDIGGPIYDDENFVRAVLIALDAIRSERGQGPVPRAAFREIYDAVRARQAGSLRRELATAFLRGPADRDLLHERTREHWTHPRGSMYPDVRDCLSRLHGQVVVGVLANQERTVVDALRRDGVADLVDVWGVSAIVGMEKPDERLFAWALAEAGVDAAEAVHVGNRLDTDVAPARRLGLGTVWVLRGEAPDRPSIEQLAEPDIAVTGLSVLPRLLLPSSVERARG
jgi:putative hydrolase of the HAD superfamily